MQMFRECLTVTSHKVLVALVFMNRPWKKVTGVNQTHQLISEQQNDLQVLKPRDC